MRSFSYVTYVFVISVTLHRSRFPSVVIFLQTEELPLMFLAVQIFWLHCFCFLFEKNIISPSLLKGTFAGYRILDWYFFSFSSLKLLLLAVLLCVVSNENFIVFLFCSFVFNVSFPLTAFEFFSLSMKLDYDGP